MCSNYTPLKAARLQACFGVNSPASEFKVEAFPGYLAPIIRLADDASGRVECVPACFGMVPHWAELKLARHTYNARIETVAAKPSFRHAFARHQFCIIPAESFFEPSYESGQAVRWKLSPVDDQPLGIAGIWEWRPNGGPDDQPLVSFSMLTMNADAHPLMQRFHQPQDEKRMLVLLDPRDYAGWLHASTADAVQYFRLYPATQLQAEPAPRTVAKPKVRPAKKPAASRPEPGGFRSLWDSADD